MYLACVEIINTEPKKYAGVDIGVLTGVGVAFIFIYVNTIRLLIKLFLLGRRPRDILS